MVYHAILALVLITMFGFVIPYFHMLFDNKLGQLNSDSNRKVSENDSRYQKMQGLAILLLLVLCGVLAFGSYQIFALLFNALGIENDFTPDLYPAIKYPLYFSVMSVILCGDVIIFGVFRKILGDKYAEFVIYYNTKYGFNAKRILYRFKTLLVFPMLLILTILKSNWCYTLTEGELNVNPFFSISRESYPLVTLSNIYQVKNSKAPNGRVHELNYYALKFDDIIIKLDMIGSFPNVKGAIQNRITKLSKDVNKPIEQIEHLE